MDTSSRKESYKLQKNETPQASKQVTAPLLCRIQGQSEYFAVHLLMALSLIDAILKKARETSQEEIDGLCTNICDLLSTSEKNAECCALVRQLFVILQASEAGAEPCIQQKVIQIMVQIVSSSSRQVASSPGTKCTLCHMIIAELIPEKEYSDLADQNIDTAEISSNISSLYLLQGRMSKCLDKGLPAIVRWLQSQDFEIQKSGLALATIISMFHTQSYMNVEATTMTNDILSQWLSSASVMQAPNPHTINPFRKDEESKVTEIDGTPNTNIFTALNIGQYYTQDQLTNIFTFSVLFKWLLNVWKTYKNKEVNNMDDEESEGDQGSHNMSQLKNIYGSLLPRSVDYCLRLIDQCERKVKAPSDSELQVACLIEAVKILDITCTLNSEHTARVFQEMKRLNTRLAEENPNSPVLVYILNFFFHHSALVVHDPQETYKHFFATVISSQYRNQGVAFDAVDFLIHNLTQVAESTSILTDYFPNIFKILAWNPRVFLNEFTSLLPAMMDWDTSVEIFHLLLDLPCMTAALEVMEKARKMDPIVIAIDAEPTSALEALYSPRFKPLFSYITRCESGLGDTVDRLANLHIVLRDCMNSTRVMVSCQVVPVLLKIWFDTLLMSEDADFVAQLIPVIIERSGIMFGVPELIQDVHKIFAAKLLVLCKAFPEIVTKQQMDICEFLQTTANMAGRVNIYTNLIYAVGEYSSQTYSPRCTSETIGKFYESLEVITYELLNQLSTPEHDASIPKVVSALMSALAKLASRCQDLIPRAILCLTKVAKQQNLSMLSSSMRDFLTNTATSLMALLKSPDTAFVVLSPDPEIYTGKWHLNNTSMPSIMRGIQRLLND